MRTELEVELEDRPGELVHVLEEVARFGGNLESVFHERARAKGSRVPVRLAFEIDPSSLPKLLAAMRGRGLRVTELAGAKVGITSAYLVIGHLFQTGGFLEIGNAVFQAGGSLTRVQADVAGERDPSAALFDITCPSDEVKRTVEARLLEVVHARSLRLVRSLDGGG